MDDLHYRFLLFQLARYEGCTMQRYQDVAADVSGNRGSRPTAVTKDDAIAVLENDLRRIAGDLQLLLPEFGNLHPVRQRVLLHIAFTLGVAGLLKLRRFIAATQASDWTLAAGEILLSPLGTQNKARAAVLAHMMRTGRAEPISDSHSGSS